MIGFRIHRLLDLVIKMTLADLHKRYAASYLGIFWAVGNPLLISLAYIFVFGIFMTEGVPGRRYGGANFVPYYMLGFAPWTIFADVLGRSPVLVLENRNLITKIKFPHVILPIQTLISALIPFVITAIIGLLAMSWSGRLHMPSQFLMQLLGIGCVILLTLGLSWLVSSLAVYIPDLGPLVSVFLTLWFFATPILYPVELVEQRSGFMRDFVLHLNPFTTAIDLFRAPFFGITLTWTNDVTYLAITSLSVFAGGLWCYLRLSKGFPDVL